MPSTLTLSDHMGQVTRLAHAFVELASTQNTHSVVLEALISAYASVAVCHPCYAAKAAHLARQMAEVIQPYAAPSGTQHVH